MGSIPSFPPHSSLGSETKNSKPASSSLSIDDDPSGAIDSSVFPPVPATISMMYIKDLTNSPGSEYDPSSDQPVQSPPNKALPATGEEGEYKCLCSPSSLSLSSIPGLVTPLLIHHPMQWKFKVSTWGCGETKRKRMGVIWRGTGFIGSREMPYWPFDSWEDGYEGLSSEPGSGDAATDHSKDGTTCKECFCRIWIWKTGLGFAILAAYWLNRGTSILCCFSGWCFYRGWPRRHCLSRHWETKKRRLALVRGERIGGE